MFKRVPLMILAIGLTISVYAASDSLCMTPECYLMKISLPSAEANEDEIRNFSNSILSINKEIEIAISSCKMIQQQDILKYRSNENASRPSLPETGALYSMLSDSELEKHETRFAKIMIELFQKYHTESRDLRYSDLTWASWLASSMARNGLTDSPESRVATVRIPQRSYLVLVKFSKDLVPEIAIFIDAIKKHLIRLRVYEQASLKATSSIAVPILVRAVEMKDLSRIKTLLEAVTEAYGKILFP